MKVVYLKMPSWCLHWNSCSGWRLLVFYGDIYQPN